MQEKLNIAVFVDYDNIEIGVKSTLRREFDVSLPLDALKERGDLVAKFAYANWGRQEGAARSMAENAVQMVQRLPSPRGDKNGGDINLALDALEMAFTHPHVNAFAIVSGDSDFIPLVNKLKEYGKTVFVVGGKAFTSTILQQNCHEFVSYESLLSEDRGQSRERAPRRAAATGAVEIHHAAAGFGIHRKGVRREQLLRLCGEIEKGRLRERERPGWALHHRAQRGIPAGASHAEAGRGAAPAARRAGDPSSGDGERRSARRPGSLGANRGPDLLGCGVWVPGILR